MIINLNKNNKKKKIQQYSFKHGLLKSYFFSEVLKSLKLTETFKMIKIREYFLVFISNHFFKKENFIVYLLQFVHMVFNYFNF